VTELQVPPGRQGPGPIPSSVLRSLSFHLGRPVAGAMPGEHRGLGVGVGLELEQLRPYEVGDDVRQLDPAASARTGQPYVRWQVPDRALTTWIVLDMSPSMAFGTADRLKCDVAEGATRVIGRLALRAAGRVGVLTFGGPGPRVLPPRGGRAALVGLNKLLSAGIFPDGQSESGLADALTRVQRLALRPGLVAVISDFREQSGWERPLRSIGARHACVAVEIMDPREGELPAAGLLALVDPETGERIEVDTAQAALRERYAAAERERREAVQGAARRARALHVELSTRGDWLRDLTRRLR
jgi:uncharacterized protein (DUF58 family)